MNCIKTFTDLCLTDRFWFVAIYIALIILGALIENQYGIMRIFNKSNVKIKYTTEESE